MIGLTFLPKGTRNLINLVQQTQRPETRFFFCSSIASVLGGPTTPKTVHEEISKDPATASPIGYSQSKWIVESICERASKQRDLEERVHVLRIGQLCGDTKDGWWNEKEGWPLLLRTAQTTGCLPQLSEVCPCPRFTMELRMALIKQRPSWLPVDLASRAMCVSRSSSYSLIVSSNRRLTGW